jgi:osmoprotectant transport system substrate-binding protein
VQTKVNLGNRELYLRALGSGEIHVVPEYLGTLTTFLTTEKDPQATSPASGDVDKTLAALTPLLQEKQWVAYTPSPAQDQNAFAVTKETADRYGLSKLSDLAKPDVQGQLTLGGPAECPTRPFCRPGLEKTYGAKFKGFRPLDAGGPLTINAIADGQVDIGLVFSSDGVVASRGLVVLEDDKLLQTADNLLPVARSDKASPDLKTALDKVSAALTTDKLKDLNKRIGVDKEDPEDLAKEFVKNEGLV